MVVGLVVNGHDLHIHSCLGADGEDPHWSLICLDHCAALVGNGAPDEVHVGCYTHGVSLVVIKQIR